MNLQQLFFTLPSVTQFIQRLEEQLIDGRNVVVVVPPWIDPTALWSVLCDRFWSRNIVTDIVDLSSIDNVDDTPPAVLLGDWLRVSWPSRTSRPTVEQLVEACRLDGTNLPSVFLLNGWDRLSPDRRERWAAFLGEWARELRSVRDEVDITLCSIIVGDGLPTALPDPDVLIETFWWWGFPSALELQILCRLGDETGSKTGLRHWREIVVPSLSGGDVRLIELLWDQVDLSFADLYARLRGFASDAGWCVEELSATRQRLRHLAGFTLPPVDGYDLWRTGAICNVPEFGVELHPAAATLINGDRDLRRRLWRGQSPYLLPLIDVVRHEICREITDRHGEGWALRWCQPRNDWEFASLQETSMACEVNYLSWLLRTCNELRADRLRLQALVEHTAWLRNRIAHHHPVTFDDLSQLIELTTRADLLLPIIDW